MVSQAVDLLEVKQKRRIYDITNVLEGIGLIEKESKNSIRWKLAPCLCSVCVCVYGIRIFNYVYHCLQGSNSWTRIK